MPATTSGQSDKAEDSKESTQNLLHVTTTNCANSGVLNPSNFKLKDGDREESSDSSDKKNFTKVEFLRSLDYARGLCKVGNCNRDSCVEFRETLEKYNPRCENWRDLEQWALQLAACICSQKNESYGGDPCKLPAVFTSMDSLVDKYRGEYSSSDPAENFAWANGVELSDVLGVLAWLNGIMSGRYQVIQESNRLQKDNKHGKGGIFSGRILEAVDRANEYNLCRHRVWAVAKSLPGGELNLPALVPPGKVSSVVAHKEHDRCTFDFCEFSRKDFTAQKQRHECKTKNCTRLTFPQQKLVEPALAGNPTAWKLHGLSIIEPNQAFMAISHVWADGTGAGPWEAGTVNKCMYDFFRGIAEQFQCEGIWWDTISIPRNDKKARKQAINNMQSNYSDARITLIHDLYLRKWEWVDAESACFAIVMSMWFSRGWTSLELVKSGRAKVVFKSGSTGCLIIKDLDEDMLAKPGEPSSPWRQVATAAIFNLRRKRITELNDILTVVGPRDTSQPKDMAIISRLLAGVEAPVDAPQQDIYQEILRKIKLVYREQLFHNSTTMIKRFSWCPSNLFDMPLALTSNLGSTPLRIQENGDVVGSWRVFSLDAFCWEGYVWTDPHPLIKLRIQLAMEDRKHLFLVEEGLITRALLVKLFREREGMLPPRRIHCQFVGPVYFTLPQTPERNKDGVEIEVRIGDMEGMHELENEKAAFDYVGEMAHGSGAMPYAESKESGQMRPENKHNENARSVLNLLEEAVSQGEHQKTTLHAAAEKGYAMVVRLLLDEIKIDNLNVQDSMGQTALLLAAANGNDEIVELLLERKADPNVADDYERTPLQRAAKGGSKAVVERLLQSGANRRALDKLGQSALLLAVERGEEDVVQILLEQVTVANVSCTEEEKDEKNVALHRAAWDGSEAVVRVLLERGFKPDTKDKDGQTALHVAVERGNILIVRVILQKSSDFANVTNAKGQTALFEAAKNGHENIIQLLLMKGADPDFLDDHSRTALSLAAEHGHKAVVELLKSLVKVDQKDTDDKVPLVYAAAGGHLDIVQLLSDSKGVHVHFRTAMVEAVKGGHDAVFKLLLEKGIGIGSKGESETLLRLAAGGGHKSLVQLLLDQRVDFNSKDQHGKTPLYYARYGGHSAVVQQLLRLENVDRKIDDAHGFPLVLQAASCGYDTMAEQLLRSHACKYEHCSTLLKQAVIHGHDAVVKLLLREIPKLAPLRLRIFYFIRIELGIIPEFYSFERAAHVSPTVSELVLFSQLEKGAMLHHAVMSGHEGVVRVLLKRGVAVDGYCDTSVSRLRQTPLHIAAENGHEAIVLLLLKYGARKNEKFYTEDRPQDGGSTALHLAVGNGHHGVVKMLIYEGVDFNYFSIHYMMLLDYEIDINRMRYDKATALHVAAKKGHVAIARLLVKKGTRLDQQDCEGNTALSLAALSGHEGIVRLLIDSGAEINVKNRQGDTARSLAARRKHERIIRLIDSGADEVNEKNRQGDDTVRGGGTMAIWILIDALYGHEGIVWILIDALYGHEGIVWILIDIGLMSIRRIMKGTW